MALKCERCGMEILPGMGRYILAMSFIADVDFELSPESAASDMGEILEEIERLSEDELTAQVYSKRTFLICRPCKEHMEKRPFGDSSYELETRQ